MKYRIISVGKIKEAFYIDGIREYRKRLAPYASLELVEGLEEKISPQARKAEIARALEKEGDKILALLGDRDLLVVLDIKGQQMTSEEVAYFIEKMNLSGKSRINFVIGGANGISSRVKKRADYLWSFSPLTFPHQMAVLILTEQLYRAFKIIKGEPYHK
ncbi:23S rRNA (pseudouridine1915-N3)-methyltransferase [Thermosyntropha lipolytica DSM 11003]|uniref:Ribosomal RNA large subunit methyltransferase H n=1 Tax=Thermosyntropha lipolytica DSM 11003 TaxID=1123382 RepID=A0A1M5R624_9FIRM|nr:23S rRNA (pseudouridine(1915)-N(3))-methyltransferase RlmH [Thermosyntropha lipolytica]SHH21263.1 23S rRNA (pseudouridine1915-N3)-methyltransferase [Thermosyntropha lipolytica DSM 11003]